MEIKENMTSLSLKNKVFLAIMSSLIAIPINIGIAIVLNYIKFFQGLVQNWPSGAFVSGWLFGLSSIIVYTTIERFKTRQRNEQKPDNVAINKIFLVYPLKLLATIISAFLTFMTFRGFVSIMWILKLPDVIPVLFTIGLPGWILFGILNILFYSLVIKLEYVLMRKIKPL